MPEISGRQLVSEDIYHSGTRTRGLSAESLAEELATFGMQSQSCTSLAEAVEEVKKLQKMEEKDTVVSVLVPFLS